MTMLDRLELWKERGLISPEQQARFGSLVSEKPFSLSLELNALLHLGVLSFVAGLGWTISTWSQQLGDIAIVFSLTAILVACFWYCFSRATAWSAARVAAPNPFFDYVLYLGSLVWCAELAYLETRFHVLAGQWDTYLLATACLFFFLAYRFDNRLVLSLALFSLAGWFGITVSRWPSFQGGEYRQYALAYGIVVGAVAVTLQRVRWKPHFFGTYLNIATNVFFWTALSGVFDEQASAVWKLLLVAACAGSLAWGLQRRQFVFVAYAAVYGYIGVSSLVVRNTSDPVFALMYFTVTATAMIIGLVAVARRFGSSE